MLIRYDGSIQNPLGYAVVGASIAVLLQPADTTSQPGSPLATIYSDALSTPQANPFKTNSPNGEYFFYAEQGTYTVQIYGVAPLLQFPQVFPDQTLAGPGGGSVNAIAITVPDWLAVTGSPVTTSGTIAITTASGQAGASFLATPFNSTGAITLRTIVPTDLAGAVFGASGPSHSVGAVPDPGASAGTVRFLREDATWQGIAGIGGGTIGGSIAANQVAFGSSTNTIFGDSGFTYTPAGLSPPTSSAVAIAGTLYVGALDAAFDAGAPATYGISQALTVNRIGVVNASTGTTNFNAFGVINQDNFAGAGASGFSGANIQAWSNNAGTITIAGSVFPETIVGAVIIAQHIGAGNLAGTYNGPVGLLVESNVKTSTTVSNITGIVIDTGTAGTPTIGQVTSLWIAPGADPGATVTTIMGVYIAPLIASATHEWAIYADGPVPSYFGGPVTVAGGIVVVASGSPATSTINSIAIPTAAGAGTFTQTIASGTAVLGTSPIASGAHATLVTVAAPGVLATDNIMADFNVDPILSGSPPGIVGYVPSATGMLTIVKFPSPGYVNFYAYNNTGISITPGAVTLNWRVTR